MLKNTLCKTFKPLANTFLFKNSLLPKSAANLKIKVDPIDFLGLNQQINEEERLIRDSARAFADESLLPRVNKDYREEKWNPQIMRGFGQNGFISPTHTQYGLPGISKTAYGLIIKEIQRVDSGYRSMVSVQSSLVVNPILEYANKSVKDELVPKLIKGELIGCFGLTEPNHGSNPAGMETNAKSDGNGGYILNGSKTWITNSPHADVFVVWAKDKTKNDRISGFVLRKGMEGLSAPKIEGKLSLNSSVTGMIVMDDVRVPAQNKLNVTGMRGPFSCLNNARFGIAWGAIGAGEACYQIARNYLIQRKQFDRPLAGFQLPQFKLAEMLTELTLAQQGVLRMSRLAEQDKLAPAVISMMKKNSCKKALDVARMARDLLGGNGITEQYHVMRHLINLQTVITYEGTYDIHNLIIGKEITGLQAFSG